MSKEIKNFNVGLGFGIAIGIILTICLEIAFLQLYRIINLS